MGPGDDVGGLLPTGDAPSIPGTPEVTAPAASSRGEGETLSAGSLYLCLAGAAVASLGSSRLLGALGVRQRLLA